MQGGTQDASGAAQGKGRHQSHVADQLRAAEQQVQALRAELAVETLQGKVDAEEAAALKQAAVASATTEVAQADVRRSVEDAAEARDAVATHRLMGPCSARVVSHWCD